MSKSNSPKRKEEDKNTIERRVGASVRDEDKPSTTLTKKRHSNRKEESSSDKSSRSAGANQKNK